MHSLSLDLSSLAAVLTQTESGDSDDHLWSPTTDWTRLVAKWDFVENLLLKSGEKTPKIHLSAEAIKWFGLRS